jgi:NAD-specific glutamate dehydrogenase
MEAATGEILSAEHADREWIPASVVKLMLLLLTQEALDEGRATDDPLNGLILAAGLTWRDVEVLRTLRNHLLQVRPHWNADTVNGVLVRNSAAAGALYGTFAARCGPERAGDRAAAVAEADAGFAAALEAEFGEREGRRLFRRYVTPESRSGLYREVTAPDRVPVDLGMLEALESRLEVRVAAKTAETASVQLCTVRALDLTDILKTLQNLGLTVTEELRIPLTLPEGRHCFLYRFDVEAPADRIAALADIVLVGFDAGIVNAPTLTVDKDVISKNTVKVVGDATKVLRVFYLLGGAPY